MNMERQPVPEELERWERIDGVIYEMSPAPSTAHQMVVSRLSLELNEFLQPAGRTNAQGQLLASQ